MENLLINDNIVCNLSTRYKAALERCPHILHYLFQPVCEGFGDHLLTHVTKANWTELENGLKMFYFGDEG